MFLVVISMEHRNPIDSHSKIDIDSEHIDFAKAFDSIRHQKPLFKVECYGFSPSLVTW